ncbi:MAG: glycosyltransferase family 2 protein [archaeon]
MNTISACILARDEEKNIKNCLQSLGSHMDEIIVLDTGSADNTINIARQFTTNVFRIQWKNDFSKAYNALISHARTDWILKIDADECLVGGQNLKKYLSDAGHNGYSFKFLFMHGDGGISFTEKDKLRLFRNFMGYQFFGIIDEGLVDADGNEPRPIGMIDDAYFIHDDYLTSPKRELRLQRNKKMVPLDRKQNPQRIEPAYFEGRLYFIQALDEIRKGCCVSQKAAKYLNEALRCLNHYLELKEKRRFVSDAERMRDICKALIYFPGPSIKELITP